MKSILFYWGKGAEVRVKIIKEIHACNKKNQACYLNHIAQKIELTHVAIKRHIDLLTEEGYVKEINPEGKPIFLALTKKGENINKEFQK